MADNVTIFSLELVPEGWFAPEAKADGWFNRDLLDTAAAGGGIVQTSRFDNANSFFGAQLNQTITQSATFTDADSFFGGTVSTGGALQTLTQTATFTDADTFFGGSLSLTITLALRFDNAQSFFGGTLGQTITQTISFADGDTFFGGSVVVVGGTQTITQDARFDDPDTFFGGSVTGGSNQAGTGFGGAIIRRRMHRRVDEAIRRVEESPTDAKARLDAIQTGLVAAKAAIDEEEALALDLKREELMLKAQRLQRETQDRAEWQMQIATAALMYEFRLLMASVQMLYEDDEDAALLLLLA